MDDYRDKLVELLEYYYGNSRDLSFKEEIVDFIENYYEEIAKIMMDDYK